MSERLTEQERDALGIRDAACGCCYVVDTTGFREFVAAAEARGAQAVRELGLTLADEWEVRRDSIVDQNWMPGVGDVKRIQYDYCITSLRAALSDLGTSSEEERDA